MFSRRRLLLAVGRHPQPQLLQNQIKTTETTTTSKIYSSTTTHPHQYPEYRELCRQRGAMYAHHHLLHSPSPSSYTAVVSSSVVDSPRIFRLNNNSSDDASSPSGLRGGGGVGGGGGGGGADGPSDNNNNNRRRGKGRLSSSNAKQRSSSSKLPKNHLSEEDQQLQEGGEKEAEKTTATLMEEEEEEVEEEEVEEISQSSSRKSSSSSRKSSSSSSALAPISIPKEYPQLLGIPLTRRPLFPGFYKSIYLKDPKAIAAVQSLLDRRQPYVGIFLATDHDSDMDIISAAQQISSVGVFAQITNVYQSGPDNNALTIVVYPHRRIKLESVVLTSPGTTTASSSSDQVKASSTSSTSTATSTSPEEVVSVVEGEDPTPPSPPPSPPLSPSSPSSSSSSSPILPVNAHLNTLTSPVGLLNVTNLIDEKATPNDTYIKALTSEILNVLKEISGVNPIIRDQVVQFSIQTGGDAFTDPAKLADFAAALCQGEPTELQGVIECLNLRERLDRALLVLKKELANTNLQKQISQEVDKKISRKQQEYFLMEQLKGIKKELGMDTDGKEKLIETFKKKAEQLKMSEAVKKVFDEELNKLTHLEPAASEFNVTRNYLDWLTQLPWGKRNVENFDIDHALTILDEDHYGLKDVKDRILEFIAVGKLRQSVEGKIICMVGPPGVGKTSIGKSIAKALGREFYRFSVGGLTDVAEIKGHRRTYVGAMPGKVVQALKKVQSENPLIMIDEVDKLGRGNQGDPASALLELLDPEQNNSFLDHYMDVPIDLSKVLFVCTANMTESIPGPLLDRMEVIQLSGYVAEEKLAIASRYLAPAAEKDSGLDGRGVNLQEAAVMDLIKFWCRESGVRNLKKHIEKIYRKAALTVVKMEQRGEIEPIVPRVSGDATLSSETQSHVKQDTTTTISEDSESSSPSSTSSIPSPTSSSTPPPPVKVILKITPETLKDYVGSAIYTKERMYDTTPVGVVMGLAWTSMGGAPLYFESVLESAITKDSKPNFRLTGHLGDVMKESSSIAYTFAKSLVTKKFPENTFFDRAAIHLHVPEGATPKDGPSAGCTMATALLSLALDRPVTANLAMTGELTLTGKILKIGGVKEKTIAAKRSGISKILFPASNKPDWEELPDYIKEGIEPVFVEWYEEIFNEIFKQ